MLTIWLTIHELAKDYESCYIQQPAKTTDIIQSNKQHSLTHMRRRNRGGSDNDAARCEADLADDSHGQQIDIVS